jgi:5-methylcytosine-specific restriction enzyme A
MAHNWDSSRRPKDPPGWSTTREYVIQRAGGRCQHESGCNHEGKDVDHIVNLASGGDHHVDNLRLLCPWHHKQKTAQEAAKARARMPSRRETRAPQPHPGLVGGPTPSPPGGQGGEVL